MGVSLYPSLWCEALSCERECDDVPDAPLPSPLSKLLINAETSCKYQKHKKISIAFTLATCDQTSRYKTEITLLQPAHNP